MPGHRRRFTISTEPQDQVGGGLGVHPEFDDIKDVVAATGVSPDVDPDEPKAFPRRNEGVPDDLYTIFSLGEDD